MNRQLENYIPILLYFILLSGPLKCRAFSCKFATDGQFSLVFRPASALQGFWGNSTLWASARLLVHIAPSMSLYSSANRFELFGLWKWTSQLLKCTLRRTVGNPTRGNHVQEVYSVCVCRMYIYIHRSCMYMYIHIYKHMYRDKKNTPKKVCVCVCKVRSVRGSRCKSSGPLNS